LTDLFRPVLTVAEPDFTAADFFPEWTFADLFLPEACLEGVLSFLTVDSFAALLVLFFAFEANFKGSGDFARARADLFALRAFFPRSASTIFPFGVAVSATP
jgi:hypothetical protein